MYTGWLHPHGTSIAQWHCAAVISNPLSLSCAARRLHSCISSSSAGSIGYRFGNMTSTTRCPYTTPGPSCSHCRGGTKPA
mgnify:CR=1 FL=1